jgi:hypothetical protein
LDFEGAVPVASFRFKGACAKGLSEGFGVWRKDRYIAAFAATLR